MLKSSVKYTATDRVRDIIEDNSQLLLALNRFNIAFGLGNSTIENVCADNNIDCSTFLAVVNIISNREFSGLKIHLPTLIDYLRNTHSYILDFILPEIRDTLIKGVHQPQLNEVALFLIKFFDEYIEEVRNHMAFEDNFVFAYIEQLQQGIKNTDFKIADFATKHNSMTSKLNELKDIFLQHYTIPNTRILNQALFNIIACGEDLMSHCEIENLLLIPAIEDLEKDTMEILSNKAADKETAIVPTCKYETLSDRETDIIRLVAFGFSNKEIADKLCLSFHTITTYRKNLSTKLNIHSTAGLTIFAIVHKIVDINEMKSAIEREY